MRKYFAFSLFAAMLFAAFASRLMAGGPAIPAVGQAAPDFTLSSQDGRPVKLSSFRGKFVVLYFYPKDATPGCTIEAHNFQRDLAQYEQANSVILGVSEDTVESHQNFCAKESLTFHLLADDKHNVATAYGSLGDFAGVKMANRNTFLISPAGTILQVWTGVQPATHSPQVLGAIHTNSVKPPVVH